jgi:protein-S-isoprenylcysteine O-methyltransferase Ste14
MWTWWAIGILLTIGRMIREDDMMKREFGREWEEWRKAVPWKVIPGVY